MTASLCPGAPLLMLCSTPCLYTSLAQTLTRNTTSPTPIWPSLAWMLAHSTSSRVMLGTSRAERERTVRTSTKQHVRRLWGASLCAFFSLKCCSDVSLLIFSEKCGGFHRQTSRSGCLQYLFDSSAKSLLKGSAECWRYQSWAFKLWSTWLDMLEQNYSFIFI